MRPETALPDLGMLAASFVIGTIAAAYHHLLLLKILFAGYAGRRGEGLKAEQYYPGGSNKKLEPPGVNCYQWIYLRDGAFTPSSSKPGAVADRGLSTVADNRGSENSRILQELFSLFIVAGKILEKQCSLVL